MRKCWNALDSRWEPRLARCSHFVSIVVRGRQHFEITQGQEKETRRMKLIRFGEPGKEKPGLLLQRIVFRTRWAWVTAEMVRCRRFGRASGGSVGASGLAGLPAEQNRVHWRQFSPARRRERARDSERAGSILQVHHFACGTERQRDHSARREEGGLGSRTCGGDRKESELHPERPGV